MLTVMLWQADQVTYDANTGKWSNYTYLPCNAENKFIPQLPKSKVDMIYLCFPNNPTGMTLVKN